MKKLIIIRSKLSLSVLWLFSIIVLTVIAFSVYKYLIENHQKEFFKNTMKNFSKNINKKMDQKSNALLNLSKTKEVKDLVLSKTNIDNIEILSILKNSKTLLNLSIAYILDTNGTVIACSPYDNNNTLTGKNYAFRPYFTKAIKGENVLYIAVGVTTKKRGLYLSAPIYINKKVCGIIVFKSGLSEIDKFLKDSKTPAIISSSDSIIFATNKQEWLYKTLVKLPNKKLENIKTTRQFANKEITYLGHNLLEKFTKIQGVKYNLYDDSFLFSTWRIQMLFNKKDHNNLKKEEQIILIISYVLFFLLISIIILLLYYITKRKEAEQKLEQHQKELEKLIVKRTEKLESMQLELIDKAHKAGMAEIAVSVLHNIGNILNSVVISTELIKEKIEKSEAINFNKASLLLEKKMDNLSAFFTTANKGSKWAEYILLLNENFKEENKYLLDQSIRVIERVDAIKNVILTQQSYAGGSSLNEALFLSDVVESAVDIQKHLLKSFGVRIEVNIKNKVPIMVQKNKLIHILINLINNAKDSYVESKIKDGVIYITETEENNNSILEIRDTGKGIKTEEISSIFNHGFTTKKGGHGFGLHSSANYMQEMGGKMTVTSKGEGKGASFFLLFPIKQY